MYQRLSREVCPKRILSSVGKNFDRAMIDGFDSRCVLDFIIGAIAVRELTSRISLWTQAARPAKILPRHATLIIKFEITIGVWTQLIVTGGFDISNKAGKPCKA